MPKNLAWELSRELIFPPIFPNPGVETFLGRIFFGSIKCGAELFLGSGPNFDFKGVI